jgi:hypothetical protein
LHTLDDFPEKIEIPICNFILFLSSRKSACRNLTYFAQSGLSILQYVKTEYAKLSKKSELKNVLLKKQKKNRINFLNSLFS